MLTVRIEELVLHGFAPGDRHRIAEALEHELARLLTERGAPLTWPGDAGRDAVDAGAFQIAAGARPDVIGGQIAEAIFASLAATSPAGRASPPDRHISAGRGSGDTAEASQGQPERH